MSTLVIRHRLRPAAARVAAGLAALAVLSGPVGDLAASPRPAAAGAVERVEPQCHTRTHPGEECTSFPFN